MSGDLRPVYEAPVVRIDGRLYCWYEDGWRGQGWYRCGYEHRFGLGWGGRDGWRGLYPRWRRWRPHHHYPHPQPNHPRPPAKPPIAHPPNGGGGHGGHPRPPT